MDDLFHSAPERANFEGKKVTSDTHFNNKKIFKETVMLIICSKIFRIKLL